jgi:hypothetical protein
MNGIFQKIILYLFEKKTLTYLLKHPLLALKNLKPIFLSSHDYINFISNLVNVSEETIISSCRKGKVQEI